MDSSSISVDRKKTLNSLTVAIQKEIDKSGEAKLNFICTHNSRRSQMAQVWASVAAYHFKHKVASFSGGTEVTAVAPQVLTAFDHFGFDIERASGKNSRHILSFNSKNSAIGLQSKLYNAAVNPVENFLAVMTCSDADDNCPFITGCTQRIPLTYNDPKHFDSSIIEQTMYQYECFKIGTEIFYAFEQLK
ncbi:MAG: protein-tyrosine-phosphatase [Crocinitomicaceae bacterium]